MRQLVRTNMPILSSQIHRPLGLSEEQASSKALVPAVTGISDSQVAEWNWPDAEARLKKAFGEGGLQEWVRAAMMELEIESRSERMKRQLYTRPTSSRNSDVEN